MNKSEFVARVASAAGISKAAAEKAVDAGLEAIAATLKKGGKVTLVGFGTFSVAKRKARTGRNPATGAPIVIPSPKVPKFTAGKRLKEAVMNRPSAKIEAEEAMNLWAEALAEAWGIE
jgi:DNA-binding protein HU-beta